VNTDRVNRWLTLGANLGVLVSLMLLVMELNQSREMMRAQTRHDLAMGIVELLQVAASNEQLDDLMYRAETGGELTPQESFQFNMRTNALLRYWEDVHYQYRVGLYDDVEFSKQREAWRAALNRSLGLRTYWCKVRGLYSPDFMSEMDALVPSDGCK